MFNEVNSDLNYYRWDGRNIQILKVASISDDCIIFDVVGTKGIKAESSFVPSKFECSVSDAEDFIFDTEIVLCDVILDNIYRRTVDVVRGENRLSTPNKQIPTVFLSSDDFLDIELSWSFATPLYRDFTGKRFYAVDTNGDVKVYEVSKILVALGKYALSETSDIIKLVLVDVDGGDSRKISIDNIGERVFCSYDDALEAYYLLEAMKM